MLKEIIHDANICCDREGLRIMTVDGSHVALVYVRLDASSFEAFYCKEEILLGANMAQVYRMLCSAGNQDTVCMYVTATNTAELVIEISNAERRSMSRFVLKLLDLDAENISIPDIQYDSTLTLPSQYFSRLCKEMAGISDTIKITSKQHLLILSCEGDYASQETVIQDNLGTIEAPADGHEVSGSFLIKFLCLFNKSFVLCNTVELHLKEGFPLILSFRVASLGSLRFALAPKLADD